MNKNDQLDYLSDAINNDTVHDAVMEAIADYCREHGLDPEGFSYNLTADHMSWDEV
jgi:hypothetical protein